jgi:hypothetical protein
MSTFYQTYLNEHDLHASIRRATLTVREQYPSAYNWAAFSIFGAGDGSPRPATKTSNVFSAIDRTVTDKSKLSGES